MTIKMTIKMTKKMTIKMNENKFFSSNHVFGHI